MNIQPIQERRAVHVFFCKEGSDSGRYFVLGNGSLPTRRRLGTIIPGDAVTHFFSRNSLSVPRGIWKAARHAGECKKECCRTLGTTYVFCRARHRSFVRVLLWIFELPNITIHTGNKVVGKIQFFENRQGFICQSVHDDSELAAA